MISHVVLGNVAQDHAAPVDPVQAGQRPSTVGWAVDANHYIGVAVGSWYPAVLGAHLVAGRGLGAHHLFHLSTQQLFKMSAESRQVLQINRASATSRVAAPAC